MPDEKTPARDDDAYRTDTFSRGDREGLPGPEIEGGVSGALKAGEAGGYDADTFSRGDREGAPGADEEADPSPAEPKPDPLKATDDRDSRDAKPPPVQDGAGGVR